jgi:NAD(P)H-dependent flavin oxidoreductase YrpB (nitropropane dioxygenase family)
MCWPCRRRRRAEHVLLPLAAALALGAESINMGTRLLAAKECWVHENVKQELAALDADPTKAFEDMKHLAAG